MRVGLRIVAKTILIRLAVDREVKFATGPRRSQRDDGRVNSAEEAARARAPWQASYSIGLKNFNDIRPAVLAEDIVIRVSDPFDLCRRGFEPRNLVQWELWVSGQDGLQRRPACASGATPRFKSSRFFRS
ncbi:MAG: hypothetical protein ACYC8W_09195, partial [Candidatus Tyrphobacter sp.]